MHQLKPFKPGMLVYPLLLLVPALLVALAFLFGWSA